MDVVRSQIRESSLSAHSDLPDRNDTGSDDVTERICATLSDAIAEGALRPGVKLAEEVIGEHFGVSRTVVRGAIAILQREHLIERKDDGRVRLATGKAGMVFETAKKAAFRTVDIKGQK